MSSFSSEDNLNIQSCCQQKSNLKLVSENLPFPILAGNLTALANSFQIGIDVNITVNTVGQPNVTVKLLQLVSV